ncbi:MAG: adenosylmethionine decarboxylase, partial [Bdellovibrionales bacterium]|nr:adenosylmethionine decarboxylase [Bdellovibrionales bacterium]
LVEFIHCNRDALMRCEVVHPILISAAEEGNSTILSQQFHQFSPHGVTGVLLLAESHISIHTWPEHSLAAVDIFTCGDSMLPEKIISSLRANLGAKEVQVRHIERTERLPEYERLTY